MDIRSFIRPPVDLIVSESPPITTAIFPDYFTKEVNTNKEKKERKKSTVTMSYIDYLENPGILKTYKIPELKSIAKGLRLHITCTKPVLMNRIENHFKSIRYAITIQRMARGHIVRECFRLKGDGYKNRAVCTNDTDPCTLEPILEIADEFFFSYRDSKGHIYGFNIISLITLLKSAKKIENPYTREVLNKSTLGRIIGLYKIIHLVFPRACEENDAPAITNQHVNTINVTQRHNEVAMRNQNTRTEFIMNQVNTPLYREIVAKLQDIRACPVANRINELFIEIDQLGNYTQSSWFSNLERREYVRLYRCLYDIWNYRAHLQYSMKRNICIIGDPFYGVLNMNTYYNDITIDGIREACLTVFENMIYCGVDVEYRKIGAFHALSALTLVSPPARLAMPWLYESVAY
jgi:hypothetical protein